MAGQEVDGLNERVVTAQLPEDALLQVFRWLPPLELLRGPRAVCRAWRQAALHPSLWRNRSLDEKYCSRQELLAVLRLVPCLRSLQLTCDVFPVQSEEPPLKQGIQSSPKKNSKAEAAAVCEHLVASIGPAVEPSKASVLMDTNCTVAELTLDFHVVRNFVSDAPGINSQPKLLRILRRQAEIGHLNVLLLLNVPAALAEDVIRSVFATDITALCCIWREPVQVAVLPYGLSDFSRSPRLKRLTYCYKSFDSNNDGEDAFLELLLETHAASLESVALPQMASRRAVELVASCPKLRVVTVPARWPEANSLSRCKQLVNLTLRIEYAKPPLLHDFFRSEVAAQLTQLSFLPAMQGETWEASAFAFGHSDVLQLVATLSASGRSVLRELNLCAMESVRLERSWLSGVLRGLPRLHTLRAQSPITEAAMDCINPASAPSLRLLQLVSFDPVEHQCGEQHCSYLQSACRLVERNPQLHVMGLAARHSCLSGADQQVIRCRWWNQQAVRCSRWTPPPEGAEEERCRWRCSAVSLYGHDNMQTCGVSVHSEPVRQWEPPGWYHYSAQRDNVSPFENLGVDYFSDSYYDMHEWLSVYCMGPSTVSG